ncbi:hypothetical protein QU516_06140 [Moellerella wisconsensis]|uniref:hypothetical protein n=1 Tax=Moellerella wisconsensis TaxID=158849 RepID=UPI0024105212|nr:hypothetical protein [Moellerella wisconsensis]WJW82992.1 hypothetical protein QU516_06140 [Moellerella wisconsensis]
MGFLSMMFGRKADKYQQLSDPQQHGKMASRYGYTMNTFERDSAKCCHCNSRLMKKLSYCNQCGICV